MIKSKIHSSVCFTSSNTPFSCTEVTHLNAVLEDVPRDGEAFLAVDWLAEDDQLLEEEDPPLLGPRQEAALLLGDGESVLLQ